MNIFFALKAKFDGKSSFLLYQNVLTSKKIK